MLDDTDRRYLRLAVRLSQDYRADERRRPFGALVVVAGQVAGSGVNQVVELADPTAHAEVMALRAATSALGRHALDDGVLYSSAEPCPMCFAASYWAAIPRIVFAATTSDVARTEFADRQLYDQLRLPGRAPVDQRGPWRRGGAGRSRRGAAGLGRAVWGLTRPSKRYLPVRPVAAAPAARPAGTGGACRG